MERGFGWHPTAGAIYKNTINRPIRTSFTLEENTRSHENGHQGRQPYRIVEMVPSHDWWSGAAGAVVGAIIGGLIGSCVPLIVSTLRRQRERRGEIDAMLAEVMLTVITLKALREARIIAPLYQQQSIHAIVRTGIDVFNRRGSVRAR
jgi:hypothetical protein